MHPLAGFALAAFSHIAVAGVLPRDDASTAIDTAVTDISDPTSGRYGQFLSLDEAIALLPRDEQPSFRQRSTVEKRWRGSVNDHRIKRADVPVNCSLSMTPECMRQLYHMGDAKASKSQKTIFGLIGFTNASVSLSISKLF